MSSSGEEGGRATPDSQCRICLGRWQSKSFPDSCLHYFCFPCLVRWSKVKPECPLCKQQFKSIIHNVRSSVEYDRYVVEEPQREEPILEPTIVLSDIMSYEARYQASYQVMVQVFRSGEENPTQLGRLRPWLKRELSVLLSAERAPTMTEEILEMLTRIHIESSAFREALRTTLGERVDHFIHELKSFALSFYDMAGFDENAQYNIRNSPLRSLQRRTVQTFPNGADSDVEVVNVFSHGVSSRNDNDVVVLDSDSEVQLIEPRTATVQEVVISSDSDDDVGVAPCPRPSSSSAPSADLGESSSASFVLHSVKEESDPDYQPDFEVGPSTSGLASSSNHRAGARGSHQKSKSGKLGTNARSESSSSKNQSKKKKERIKKSSSRCDKKFAKKARSQRSRSRSSSLPPSSESDSDYKCKKRRKKTRAAKPSDTESSSSDSEPQAVCRSQKAKKYLRRKFESSSDD